MRKQVRPKAGLTPFPRSERSGGKVCQSDHALTNEIVGHKPQLRPRPSKEWLAVTEDNGVQIESIFINKTKVGEASCEVWSGDFNFAGQFGLQASHHRFETICDKSGVGADRFQRARHDPLRLAPPRRCEVAFLRKSIQQSRRPNNALPHTCGDRTLTTRRCGSRHTLLGQSDERAPGLARTPGGRRSHPGIGSIQKRAWPRHKTSIRHFAE